MRTLCGTILVAAALAVQTICVPAVANVAAFDSRIASDAEQASKDGFVWKDAAAFPLESKVCASTATPYGRIPADMMDKVPPGVKWMAGHSTGHYFLLETDSPKFGVRWKCVQTSATDPYIPPQGMYGIDIYMREGAGWRFLKNGRLGGGSDEEQKGSNKQNEDWYGSERRDKSVAFPSRFSVAKVFYDL